jgi:hypothetical protein
MAKTTKFLCNFKRFCQSYTVIVVSAILDTVHCLRTKKVSEARAASIFRWNTEKGERTPVCPLERA